MYGKKEQEEEIGEEKDDYRNLTSPLPAISLKLIISSFVFMPD